MTRTALGVLVIAGLIGLMYGLTRIRQGMAGLGDPFDILEDDE